MFTSKAESGEKITKLGVGADHAKTERPATYASKSPGPTASKMVPSILGEDLTIRGNVTSKGELQVDGEVEGDIRCGSLLLSDKSKVTGDVAAEDVVVRGHVVGSVRGLRITLQAQSHVEGDIFHQSLAIEHGAYFEGKSRRSDDPLAEIKDSANFETQPATNPQAGANPSPSTADRAIPTAPEAVPMAPADAGPNATASSPGEANKGKPPVAPQ
jgi:cytoskeletal protein CcmA (bactofilin family)